MLKDFNGKRGTRVGLHFSSTSFDKNWLVSVEGGSYIFELPF